MAVLVTVLAVLAAAFNPSARATSQSSAPDAMVGCWRYSNGLVVNVDKNGTMTMGQVKGKWRQADAAKRVYVWSWPEIQDNAIVSADGKTLTETNPWFTLNATRMAGDSGIVGMWQWPGGALILTIRPDNTFAAGPISGRWQAANLGERTYTLIWPPPIHTGTLAPDGQKFSGADQYGNQFATAKESCPVADLDPVGAPFNMTDIARRVETAGIRTR